MKNTYPPIIFLTSETEKAAFLEADVALSSAQHKGNCELVMIAENLFSELYQRLDDPAFADRLFIFHWVGDSSDSTFIEGLIRRLSTLPNLACLILEDIGIPPSATIAHLLPITIAVSKPTLTSEDSIFSSHFYEQIAQNSSIKEAYNYASRKVPQTPSTMFVKPSAENMLDLSLSQTKEAEEPEPSPEQEKITSFKKIIKQKARFSAFSKPELLLSEKELRLFDKYKFQISPLSDIETQLYQRSLNYLQKRHRKRRYLYRVVFFLTVFLGIAGLGFWMQYREAQRQEKNHQTQIKQQQANFLTYLGNSRSEEDPTKAIRIIEKGWKQYPTPSAQGSLYEVFYKGNLYYTAQVSLNTTKGQIQRLDSLNDKTKDRDYIVSSDGQWLVYYENAKLNEEGQVVAGSKNALFIRSLEGDIVKRIDRNQSIEKIAFSNDFPYRLAVGFSDGNIEILDVYGKNLLELTSHTGSISGLAFSKDDTKIISAADTTALIWTTSGEILDTLSGNQKKIVKMQFSPSQELLFTESKDSVVAIWQEASLVSTFEGKKAKWLSNTHLAIWQKIETQNKEKSATQFGWVVWNVVTNQTQKTFKTNTQLIPQDSISFWVIDAQNRLSRHYFDSDSVRPWQNDVAYFAMHKDPLNFANQKWVIISKDGVCKISFANGSIATTELKKKPISQPYFTQDGKYLVLQTDTEFSFWRAASSYEEFADEQKAKEILLEDTNQENRREIELIYYSGNIYRLVDGSEVVRAEFKADKVSLHPSKNYILALKNNVLTLLAFDDKNLKTDDEPFKLQTRFTRKADYYQVGLSERGSFVWATTQNNQLLLLDLNGKVFHQSNVKPNTVAVSSFNDNYLALSQSYNQKLRPYQIIHPQKKQSYTLDTRLERTQVSALFFAPNNDYLVSASDRWTDFWDLRGRRIKTIRGGNPIFGNQMLLTSSPNHFFISTLEGQTIYHKEVEGLEKAELSSDKAQIILYFPDKVQIWRASPFSIIEWLNENKIYQLSTQESKQLRLK